MSEGLENIDFSTVNLSNGVNNELTQNGDSEEKSKVDKVKNKRPNSNTSEVPTKKKKKSVKSVD